MMNVDEEEFGKIPWKLVKYGISQSNVYSKITIPQVFPVHESIERFYVRECYPMMYDDIIAKMQLNTTRLNRNRSVMCAVVFGTPGIGKSIFEFYFFNRYTTEHPGACYSIIRLEMLQFNGILTI